MIELRELNARYYSSPEFVYENDIRAWSEDFFGRFNRCMFLGIWPDDERGREVYDWIKANCRIPGHWVECNFFETPDTQGFEGFGKLYGSASGVEILLFWHEHPYVRITAEDPKDREKQFAQRRSRRYVRRRAVSFLVHFKLRFHE